jgi:hypothetical protein
MPSQSFRSFEKDYLLLHEILQTLRRIGLTITAMGTEVDGKTLFYEFQLPTARLHFSTLVALVNDANKFKAPAGQINYWQNIIIKDKDIDFIRYTADEVAAATEILEGNGEVKIETVEEFLSVHSKIIQLTDSGLISLNGSKYLKEYEKERNARTLFESTLNTNHWMKIFTGIIAISAIVALIFQGCSVLKSTSTPLPPIVIKPDKRCFIDSIYIVNDSLPPLSGAHHKAFSKEK